MRMCKFWARGHAVLAGEYWGNVIITNGVTRQLTAQFVLLLLLLWVVGGVGGGVLIYFPFTPLVK